MGKLLDSPVHLLILVVIILLIFGAPKLPGMARSLGQSMRIFKSEVDGMKKDNKRNTTTTTTTTTSADDVVTGEVINNTERENQ